MRRSTATAATACLLARESLVVDQQVRMRKLLAAAHGRHITLVYGAKVWFTITQSSYETRYNAYQAPAPNHSVHSRRQGLPC
jgi:hypothetical protein